MAMPKNDEGRRRVVIEGVMPVVDGGRFPIKRVVGDSVRIEADIFVDGHDVLDAVLCYRPEHEPAWRESPLDPAGNDRWRGEFTVDAVGRWQYTLLAWIDHFLSWRHDLTRRVQSEDIAVALQIGADLIEQTAARASAEDAGRLHEFVGRLRGHGTPEARRAVALDAELLAVMTRHPDRRLATRYESELTVVVDPPRAACSAWYEFFPRSCGVNGKTHGGFRDCEARLERIAAMGFDTVYLPPIHPIGHTKRKGRNNSLAVIADDPGSPWAIGAEAGGHKAIHTDLGSLEDFRHFRQRAEQLGLDLAIDIAFQCSPDHPYVREHPDWFLHRPDGSVQYAENPPKKYEDIYPFHFESEAWQALWQELESVFEFWIGEGVLTFRVDNPHTKPFPFWEWVIGEVKRRHPEAIFLAEAFSRPRIMYRLAKLGFSQSYTYFTWRNTKWELIQYLNELTRGEVREYFRPHFWPNTPDILPEYLQFGGRPAFMTRLVLAATLSSNYGVYGPAYELADNTPREAGSEEYLDSEKYQTRRWDEQRPDSLADFMRRVNEIRRDNPALRRNDNLRFYPIDNEELIAYGKASDDLSSIVIVVVNLDAYHTQGGWLELPLERLDLDPRQPYQVHDLLTGARFLWNGPRNYVQLDPQRTPAHIFRLRRRVRTERDFEYFF